MDGSGVMAAITMAGTIAVGAAIVTPIATAATMADITVVGTVATGDLELLWSLQAITAGTMIITTTANPVKVEDRAR